ncbi:MAG: SPFH domain-containing protein [Bdellovibrionaceae bacterium]|nr:SPFH domain-containing protein [Pseudobdellovibrionaceae bacterium]
MVFNFFKKQLIDVIEWSDEAPGVLSYRYPMQDREIQNGAQLTVRQTQIALFVNEGVVADLFGPGMHTLATRNLPVLTNLQNWDKAFQSPFKSDLIFFTTNEQIDQKWGTASPITVRDKDFGVVRIRAFGTFSYRLKNPKVFFQKLSANQEVFTAGDLEGQLKSTILTSLATYFGKSQISFLDMAAHQESFSQTLKTQLMDDFSNYGLSLESFFVQSVSLPEEVQAQIDKIGGMKITGNMKDYTQFQTAESLTKGGTGAGTSAGIELAAALAMGQNMAKSFQGSESGGGSGADANEGILKTINQLHDLKTKGVISDAEFETKKAELLKQIK